MSFKVTILGCGSATPTAQRNPTAQVVELLGRFFLIDCAEGTQIQLRRNKINFQHIDHIFISHLHGDHFFGLIGFISSMHLWGRTKPLNIYANEKLKEIIDLQLTHSDSHLRYEIIWHNLSYNGKHLLYADKTVEVYSFPLNHRIPTCGFLIQEKQKERNLIRAKVVEYDIPLDQITAIKQGSDLLQEDGTSIPNGEITTAPPSTRDYAYCSDTIYDENVVQYIKDATLLYHEATFMHNLIDRAKETYHSTTIQAATIAKLANVGQLVIGHYSARYADTLPLLEEARTVFANTQMAMDGREFII
jgi:ribonuclease Z